MQDRLDVGNPIRGTGKTCRGDPKEVVARDDSSVETETRHQPKPSPTHPANVGRNYTPAMDRLGKHFGVLTEAEITGEEILRTTG